MHKVYVLVNKILRFDNSNEGIKQQTSLNILDIDCIYNNNYTRKHQYYVMAAVTVESLGTLINYTNIPIYSAFCMID